MVFLRMRFPAAKKRFSVLGLAALLFLVCPELSAQELNVNLTNPYSKLLDWNALTQERGLSISLSTVPLLERKAKFKREIDVDYGLDWVEVLTKAGNYPVGPPLLLNLQDYISMTSASQAKGFWLREHREALLNTEQPGKKNLLGLDIPVKFPKAISRIVGEGGPGLKVNGYRKLSFAGRSQWQEGFTNTATSRQSKFPSLELEQESRFTITGTVGSKITVKVDQDSRRMSDLENNIQLRYNGEEDEIIKSIELGNTSWSIPGLAGYSGTIKGLFGAKATAQFGGLDMTVVASQEKGSTQKAVFQAGAEVTPQFIRDYEFLRWTYFYLGRPEDFSDVDSILELKIYLGNQHITSEGGNHCGMVYLDPNNRADTTQAYWCTLKEVTDSLLYYYTPTMDGNNYFWIKLKRSLDDDEVLGVYYRFRDKNGVGHTVGNLVYEPDSNVCSEEDTAYLLKLIKPENPRPSDATWDYEWKNVYDLRGREIQREGFELKIYKGDGDLSIDKNYQESDKNNYLTILGLDSLNLDGQLEPDGIIDLVDEKINLNEGLLIFPTKKPFCDNLIGLDDTVHKIYYLPNNDADRTHSTKYYIYIKSASRKLQYSLGSLGRMNIIEGSEIVTLNGQRLVRGTDYNIIYELGQITFITDRVLDPTANVTIDYEYAPLFMLEKKTLFGLNTNYDMGNLNLGFSALYKSEQTGENRPRVGMEPTRNFIWDASLGYKTSPWILTKLVDALPLVEADAPSELNINAEVAQSLPNPNTKNDAFIDDFEGSLEYTDMGVQRGIWTVCSASPAKSLLQRGRMIWYNPWNRIKIKDIWPRSQTTDENDLTDVLVMKLYSKTPQVPASDSFDIADTAWNGILRALPKGSYDQSKTEFLEIWLKGDKAKLHIDFGQISEDINGDRVLNTEDKRVNGFADGILQDEEDVGLDGMLDAREKAFYTSNLSDPSGDNWGYSNKDVYDNINGTEGNRDDPDRGRRPDTEDINENGALDLRNDYFEFTLDLATDAPTDSTEKGWKLYRIPIKEQENYSEIGIPDWSNIRFCRLWIEDKDRNLSEIDVASLQLVGNRWRSLGAFPAKPDSPAEDGGSFKIFVINTYENSGYTPPSGVAGIVDPNTGVREKEQSLVLKYDSLSPGFCGAAYRELYNPENYTNYKGMKMYVHAPDDFTDTTELKFFFRVGTDSLNFYEYHTNLYGAWDERNYVLIDFEEITGLKSHMFENSPDSGGYNLSQGHYRIRGKPSLSSVKWFCMGVENDSGSSSKKSGEIWTDELRVTDVRRNPGWSIRSSVSARFADFLDVSLELNRIDSEFHNLRDNRGSGINTTNRLFRTSINLDKFLPPWWGFKLPFSYSWSRNLDVPRLKRGSDIVLPGDQREKEKRESIAENFNFNPSFSRNTKNRMINWTLNRISTNMSYSRQKDRSPETPVSNSSRYWISSGYNFPPSKLYLSPLAWSKKVFMLKKISNTKFYYLPSKLSFNGDLNGRKSFQRNEVGSVTSEYVRDFTGVMNLGLAPVSPMSVNYTRTTDRDLRNDDNIKFSLNPQKIKLGIERRLAESFKVSYNPKLFPFLDHTFSFNSNYNENCNPFQFQDRTRSVDNSNTKSANFTLKWNQLLGKISPGSKSKGSSKEKEKTKTGSVDWIRKKLGFLANRINPLVGSVSRSKSFKRSGLFGRPSFKYQLGLVDAPGVGMKPTVSGALNDNVTMTDSYGLRSGMKVLKSADISLSYSQAITDMRNPTSRTENRSKTFPDLSFSWNNINRFGPLNRYLNSWGFKSGYSKKVDISRDKLVNEPKNRSTSISFSPLVSFSLAWKNGIQTNLTANKSEDKQEDLRTRGSSREVIIGTDKNITLTNSYSFRAPHGIKLPFLKKLKFESNLSLSLDISHRTRKQKKSIQAKPFNPTQHRTELSITPRAGYNFSSQVQAGLSGSWIDINDKMTKIKSHVREFGIWAEIQF